jgi:hypothetical protein
MTEWSNFNYLKEVLIIYYFGNPLIFYLATIALFLLLFVMAGIDFRSSIVYTLPLVAAFSIGGFFGEYSYIINIALLVVSLIYGYAILKLMT